MSTVSRSLCFLVCLYLPGLVFAQQPRVYRDRVEPNWFADDTAFWYRVELPGGESEFLLVNTVTGNCEAAFDHARVADKLSKLTRRDFVPEKLPFTTIEFDDQMKTVTLGSGRDSWRLDLSTYEVEAQSSASAELPGKRFFSRKRKSVSRGGDVQLEVHNALSVEVDLVWVNRSGSLQTYGTLKPGDIRSQHTFVGHVWLLQSGGKPLAYFEATDNHNEIEVTEGAIKGLREKASKSDPLSKSKGRRRTNPASSPDGKFSAYVEGHNLWLRKLLPNEDSQVTQLSRDGSAENSFQKDASRARIVEMNYERSDPPQNVADVRWSPDSKYVVALQTTKVVEPRVHYIESSPQSVLQPRLNSYPYAKPGDAIPVPTPRLFSTEDSREIALSTELFPNPFKLQFLKWSEDGRRFWMLYNERGHQRLRVLEGNVADGGVRAVVDESSETFIHYSTSGKFVLEWLGATELLWASERSGWNHLYRYDVATGQPINAVTTGEWNVRRIEHIDRDTGVVWFYAVGVAKDQDPYHEHFCRVRLDGSGFAVLTQGDGTHEIQWSPDRKFFIDRYSRVDMGPVSELRRSLDGTLVVPLEQADVGEIVKARGRLPQRFVAKGRDGATDIYGLIHFPRSFDPQLKYPVVENIYAGPHDHHVPKAFRTSYRHQHQIADRGAIVVQIDGMGTAWRSKKFHDVCYKNLRDAGFPDRIAWLKAAAREYPFIDIGRVGIYGGSAGGQNAMAALLWHGTFYKAAVSDCGCHDNRMDKLWWNEQWMGWPVDEAYAANSNTENAHRLQGKLMLVVGELDRNVDPASTTQVVDALIKADKDFTFLPVPGAGHGACERPYGSRKRAEFLATHLNATSAE